MADDTTNTGGAGSPERLTDPIETPTEEPIFNQEQCIFCNKLLGSFESNVAHMQIAHGLFVPDRKRLIVELETLFSYLHLVIAGYNECICCGTQRSSTLAVQQHMLGKGHCMFDIAGEDSEFADFYDSSSSASEAESDWDDDDDYDAGAAPTSRKRRVGGAPVQVDEHSLRLPSGKVITNRSQPQNNTRRQLLKMRASAKPDLLEDAPGGVDLQAPPSSFTVSPPTALVARSAGDDLVSVRAQRQEIRFTKQLASLRANDERSLAHLPLPQQRSLLATRQKQVEKAIRVEERYRGRLEGLGNRFLMTHFVKDAADKRTLWK